MSNKIIMPELVEIWKVIEGEVPVVNTIGTNRHSSRGDMSHLEKDRGNNRDYRIALLKRDALEIAE